jgi:hypothetical protein
LYLIKYFGKSATCTDLTEFASDFIKLVLDLMDTHYKFEGARFLASSIIKYLNVLLPPVRQEIAGATEKYRKLGARICLHFLEAKSGGGEYVNKILHLILIFSVGIHSRSHAEMLKKWGQEYVFNLKVFI